MEDKLKGIDFQAVLDGIDDGIFVFNASGKLLMVNKAAERGGSLKREQLVGKSINELLRQGYCDEFVSSRVLKSRKKETIAQRSEDGSEFIVTGIPYFENGKLVMVVACERDITNLVRLEEKLSEVEHIKNVYEEEINHLKKQDGVTGSFVYASKNMQKVVRFAEKVSAVDSTILVLGESGTGKEVIVNYIQQKSARANQPFIKVNCGAIPENLLESELFGYEEGAFTGAVKSGRIGLFEAADKGTVFLDEIGELPMLLQVKLLRAIQERKITRVGGSREIPLDVRIIAATNRDLKSMVKSGTFREDLYYRLSVITISIPPLRERKEDIINLVMLLVDKYNKKYHMKKKVSSKAMTFLMKYDWPGNVRELENLIESVVITAETDSIHIQDVYDYVSDNKIEDTSVMRITGSLTERVEAYEKQLLKEYFEEIKDTGLMARALNSTRSTINRKLRKYGIR